MFLSLLLHFPCNFDFILFIVFRFFNAINHRLIDQNEFQIIRVGYKPKIRNLKRIFLPFQLFFLERTLEQNPLAKILFFLQILYEKQGFFGGKLSWPFFVNFLKTVDIVNLVFHPDHALSDNIEILKRLSLLQNDFSLLELLDLEG